MNVLYSYDNYVLIPKTLMWNPAFVHDNSDHIAFDWLKYMVPRIPLIKCVWHDDLTVNGITVNGIIILYINCELHASAPSAINPRAVLSHCTQSCLWVSKPSIGKISHPWTLILLPHRRFCNYLITW